MSYIEQATCVLDVLQSGHNSIFLGIALAPDGVFKQQCFVRLAVLLNARGSGAQPNRTSGLIAMRHDKGSLAHSVDHCIGL